MQREKSYQNVPVNEINVRFRKKNKTPKTKKVKFLWLLLLHRIKESIRAISKCVSVQVSVASENCDLNLKTVWRELLYGVGGLITIKKLNVFAIHNDHNTERSKS